MDTRINKLTRDVLGSRVKFPGCAATVKVRYKNYLKRAPEQEKVIGNNNRRPLSL